MDEVRTSRGRPRREDESKREVLLRTARDIMRRKPRVHLLRTEVAKAASTAPALVTYYFKDDASLVHAAAQPVLQGYLAALADVLRADGDDLYGILRQLIVLLVRIGGEDGQLVESYANFLKAGQTAGKADFLIGPFVDMDRFFRRCVERKVLRPMNSAFFLTAVWGICKTVAQTSELTQYLSAERNSQDTDIALVQADLILALITDGAAHRDGATPTM